ncbi:hypothetical protein [Pedobacter sp. FW305-3-2-15-E-R2A2]|uniref:hypothetical protein n=1 Tax=Pedobacter sp. FW305-3-2-15-E-R2A2 TaxID=3140251 RepID=UPI0031407D81
MKVNIKLKKVLGLLKKKPAILALVTICNSSALAQVDIGYKFGGVSTDVRANSNFSDKNRISYQLGLYLNFDPLPFLSLQTEVLYNRTRLQNMVAVDGLKTGMKGMGYWSVPLLFQVNPLPFLRVGAGPQWNFHTNRYKYRIAENQQAFKNFMSLALDAEVKVSTATRLYIRLNKGIERFENISDGKNGRINRWEFGIQRSLMKK